MPKAFDLSSLSWRAMKALTEVHRRLHPEWLYREDDPALLDTLVDASEAEFAAVRGCGESTMAELFNARSQRLGGREFCRRMFAGAATPDSPLVAESRLVRGSIRELQETLVPVLRTGFDYVNERAAFRDAQALAVQVEVKNLLKCIADALDTDIGLRKKLVASIEANEREMVRRKNLADLEAKTSFTRLDRKLDDLLLRPQVVVLDKDVGVAVDTDA